MKSNPSKFPLNERQTFLNDVLSDYVVRERVGATYLGGIYNRDNFRLTSGVRYEHTNTHINRLASVTRGAGSSLPADLVKEVIPQPSSTTKQYIVNADQKSHSNDWLPSTIIEWRPQNNIKLIAGFSQAIGRPNPSELAANATVSETGTPTINRGNPNLKPRKSNNFDLQGDYYFPGSGGVIGIGLFHKRVKRDIFRVTSYDTIGGVTYQINQPENVSSAKITGLELNLVRNELGLPIKGFGFSANATFFWTRTHIPMNDGTRRKLKTMLGQARRVANIAVFYQSKIFEGRMAYAYTGRTKVSIATNTPDEDQTERPFGQLDLQARVKIRPDLMLIGEVRNVTSAHRVTRTGPGQNLARDINYFGRMYWFGLSAKF